MAADAAVATPAGDRFRAYHGDILSSGLTAKPETGEGKRGQGAAGPHIWVRAPPPLPRRAVSKGDRCGDRLAGNECLGYWYWYPLPPCPGANIPMTDAPPSPPRSAAAALRVREAHLSTPVITAGCGGHRHPRRHPTQRAEPNRETESKGNIIRKSLADLFQTKLEDAKRVLEWISK